MVWKIFCKPLIEFKATAINKARMVEIGTETKTMYELATQTKSVDKTFTPQNVPKNQSMDISKLKKTL